LARDLKHVRKSGFGRTTTFALVPKLELELAHSEKKIQVREGLAMNTVNLGSGSTLNPSNEGGMPPYTAFAISQLLLLFCGVSNSP